MVIEIIILFIFWQPTYWAIRYLISEFMKKDQIDADFYSNKIKAWFSSLWGLVKPSKDTL